MAASMTVWLFGHVTLALSLNGVFHNVVLALGFEIPDLCMQQGERFPLSSPRRCGDGFCWCAGDVADCSGHVSVSQPDLTYIPKLPENVRYLDFSKNGAYLSSKQFFANATNVTHLSLGTFRFENIEESDLNRIENLTCLSLVGNGGFGQNLETSRNLQYILSIPTLQELSIAACGIFMFSDVLKSSIKTLDMSFNIYLLSDLTEFCSLKELKELFLNGCHRDTLELDCVVRVHRLHLAHNKLLSFPKTCNGDVSLLPNLEYLNMANNGISSLRGNELCLPKLKVLDLAGNLLTDMDPYMFSIESFPSLLALNLGRQILKRFVPDCIGETAFKSASLKVLSLAYKGADFSASGQINGTTFTHCPQLQKLILDGNNFLRVEDDRFVELFGPLRLLATLSLKYCQIEGFSARTFASFPNLSVLYLTGNRIQHIPDGAFDMLPKLHSLDLSSNQILTVHKSTFSEETRQRLSSFYLGNNSFVCSCDILWFKHWLISQPSLFYPDKTSRSSYECRNIRGMKVEEFSMNEQPCILSREMNTLIIISCSFAILAFTVTTLVFRYRWHLRLLMHEAFRGRNDYRRLRLQTNVFDYDVFVSYASAELPWVREHLMAELEDRLGLRLCVLERDFISGKNIVDNIADCVQSSKKILMVFSKDFVRSQWCQFELAYCLRQVMDYDDALIVVCVDDVTSRNMTTAMMAVMKTTTYIQWAEHDDAIGSFWGRLHLSLRDVIERDDHVV